MAFSSRVWRDLNRVPWVNRESLLVVERKNVNRGVFPMPEVTSTCRSSTFNVQVHSFKIQKKITPSEVKVANDCASAHLPLYKTSVRCAIANLVAGHPAASQVAHCTTDGAQATAQQAAKVRHDTQAAPPLPLPKLFPSANRSAESGLWSQCPVSKFGRLLELKPLPEGLEHPSAVSQASEATHSSTTRH